MATHQPARRTMRLQDIDYRQPGYYFVTVCVKNHKLTFGKINKDKMDLNHNGLIVQQAWSKLPQRFPGIELDEYIIMPNHMHGIIILKEEQPILFRKMKNERVPERFKEHLQTRPYKHMPVLGQMIRAFKAEATYYIHRATTPDFAWQGRYYENILSSDKALESTRLYIVSNPSCWARDKLYQDG